MKHKEKIIGSIIILCIFAIFLIVGLVNDKKNSFDEKDIFVDEQNEAKDSREPDISKDIKVEIKGEVLHPGVYTLPGSSRVQDLVFKAGGFTESADTDNMISLAKKLRDEDCIIVRKKLDIKGGQLLPAAGGDAVNSRTADGKININLATKEELDSIPGIGEVTAQKIIDYREQYGGFNSIEDLKKIDRIGDKMLNGMRDKIDVR